MKASRVSRQLLFTVLVMTGIPLVASFYFLNAALERSLNLGFNPQVVRALDTSAENLKALKDADPANEASYRKQFEEVSALRHIYSQSQLLKQTVQSSLRLCRRGTGRRVRCRFTQPQHQSLVSSHVR
jgi:hypothetical protein